MSSLPLTCDPWAEQEPLGFPVSFAPRRYRRRTSRWGQVTDTDPKSRLRHQPTLQSTDSLATCDLMSHALRIPAFPDVLDTCATLPCERLSRSPWWGVTPTTTIGTPSP